MYLRIGCLNMAFLSRRSHGVSKAVFAMGFLGRAPFKFLYGLSKTSVIALMGFKVVKVAPGFPANPG